MNVVDETVAAAMFDIVDGRDVVPVFVDVDCAVEIDPGTRFVVGVDFVALHLPRADPRKRVIVVTELEISRDAQGIHGAGGEARQQRILADPGKVAGRVIACRRAGKCQRNKLASRRIHVLGAGSWAAQVADPVGMAQAPRAAK